MKYIYIMEIDFKDKEIIITTNDKLIRTMIPCTHETLMAYEHNFSDFEFVELDERFLRFHADRFSIMNPN